MLPMCKFAHWHIGTLSLLLIFSFSHLCPVDLSPCCPVASHCHFAHSPPETEGIRDRPVAFYQALGILIL